MPEPAIDSSTFLCDLETRASSIFGAGVWPFSNPERKSLNETYLSNIAAWGSRGHSAPLSLDYCCLSNQPTSNRKWNTRSAVECSVRFTAYYNVSCCISLRVSPRVSLRYTAVRVSLCIALRFTVPRVFSLQLKVFRQASNQQRYKIFFWSYKSLTRLPSELGKKSLKEKLAND